MLRAVADRPNTYARIPITWLRTGVLALSVALLWSCSPTVKVEAPDKPIVINLNVKIEQEVRIKVEKDAEELLSNKPELF